MPEHRLPGTYNFAALETGITHYRLDGPDTGATVLMIHGATVPGWQFDRLAPLLNEAGFRTLRLDLFGHGYSARPRVVHDCDLFVRQVTELLDYLALSGRIALLGHSFGAALAARLALSQPARYGAVVLAAPLLDYFEVNRSAHLLRAPWLGELLMTLYVLPMLLCRRTLRYRGIGDGSLVYKFRDQLRVPGFGRSLLSLVRSDALGDQSTAYRRLSAQSRPVLVLCGAQDAITGPAQLEVLRDVLPRADHQVLEDATHALCLTHPGRVAGLVARFLSRPEDRRPQLAEARLPFVSLTPGD